MMFVYRIEKEKYAKDWPSRGSLFSHGRWHRKGFWIIYCSSSIALAKLETLANSIVLPKKRVVLKIGIDESAPIKTISTDSLPEDWMVLPYNTKLSDIR